MLEEQNAQAQQVLDELMKERLLPFELTVGKLLNKSGSTYEVHFHDSRIHSLQFSWSEGESYRERFRVAVLDRVERMSGPLYRRMAS